jgi:hypothetical protein
MPNFQKVPKNFETKIQDIWGFCPNFQNVPKNFEKIFKNLRLMPPIFKMCQNILKIIQKIFNNLRIIPVSKMCPKFFEKFSKFGAYAANFQNVTKKF